MTEPSDFTVTELLTRAKALGLQFGGTKAEIIARLTAHDPTGGWMKDDDLIELGAVGKEVQDSAWNDADSGREREFADREKDLELMRREREIEFSNRERELMRRELELARREIDMLRRNDCASAVESEPRARDSREDAAMAASRLSTNLNLKMITELVSEFDGTPDVFDVWERQVQFMKATYNLADDAAKTLIGMKLRKKAFEWLHSRAEHLAMTFDDLMSEIGRMYCPKQNKIDLRKKFEARVWKKGTHAEFYDKRVFDRRVRQNNVARTIIGEFDAAGEAERRRGKGSG
ncbi:hypothetical protein DMN91_012111 [Ooceraea biroi]|uniref:SAP domain-containing protein n=1 Tax=Ooceraea biroi TaxID=2015173 RepID=A0A3L8D7V8_OOCBI|nr:hypothetical protein DMN91_012111 [Ooceraea biroi]